MYIIKNAFKCISRSVGRNVLIGVIVLAIAVSACLGLSIRQAAENAKSETLEGMSVTATISFDRQSMMGNMMNGGDRAEGEESPSFDRNQFSDLMGASSGLTLDEYKTYASASSVQDFYYELSAALNGSDEFLPVSTQNDTGSQTEDNSLTQASEGFGGMGGGRGGMGNMMMGAQSDFSVVGVSGESAMTSFVNGTASITDGSIFEEGTSSYECIITEELATYNSISVGDDILLTNPNNEEESFPFTVTGLYSDASANQNSFSIMGSTSTDPANKIYMSYNALSAMISSSEENSQTLTDEDTGREYSTDIAGSLSATYSFADVEGYYQFEDEVRELGLGESYTVSSSDLTAFENSLVPLETLSKMAGYFLIVILIIGAIILIVLNIFNVRERKYEIGVLTAMGMKKGKVAMQFLTEIFAVTMVAVIIGVCAGGAASVPVTNALLEGQVTAQSSQSQQREENFGRGDREEILQGNISGMEMPDNSPKGLGGMFGKFGQAANNYITEIDSAMNFTVVFQMLGIAVLLTLASGAVSMLFVMRYDPLKILANRD